MKPSIWPHFTANDVLYYLQHTGSGLEAWNLPRYTFQPTHAILILGCLIDWNFLIFFLFWEFHGKWKRWRRKSTETDISFSWYNFSSVTWKSSAFSIFSPSQRRPPFHGHYSSGCCYRGSACDAKDTGDQGSVPGLGLCQWSPHFTPLPTICSPF